VINSEGGKALAGGEFYFSIFQISEKLEPIRVSCVGKRLDGLRGIFDETIWEFGGKSMES
jgi:hypothetical protein